MAYQARGVLREQSIVQLHALLELSGKNTEDVTWMIEVIRNAPDSATAVFEIDQMLGVQSEALQEKWSKHVSQVWFTMHPNVPASLQLDIMSHDVMCADALLEAHALLQELAAKPAQINNSLEDGLISLEEEKRIATALRIFAHDVYAVRRAIAVLQELRLVRPVSGEVRVVKSRYARFQALPLSCQYYLLWHVDMYHLDWKEYIEMPLESHMAVFQQYLPMIWEMLERTSYGQTHMTDEFAWHVVRAFRPLWQQGNALGLYEQSSLQSMVDEWLIDKVFARYGLIECHASQEQQDTPKSFSWTRLGASLLDSERTVKLPCATDILQ